MKFNQNFLPLRIQLFAEDSGTGVAGAPAESGVNDESSQGEGKEKTYTRDEVNKMISAERDKVKAEIKKKADDEKTEAEKLAKMDAEEKHKYELEKIEKEKNEALSKVNAYELKEQATKMATEKGLDISLLDLIDYPNETADSVKTKLETIDSVVKKAVENGINERLREKSPRQISSPITSTGKEYLDKKYKNNPYYKK